MVTMQEKLFRTKQDIVIPAGTVLSKISKVTYGSPHFEGYVAFGDDHTAFFHVDIDNIKEFPEVFEVHQPTEILDVSESDI
jgi:hypothetical protein